MKGISLKPARLSKGYVPPRFHDSARMIMNLTARSYLKNNEHLNSIRLLNPEPFCHALKDHQEGKYRLILLFRHCEKADAPALMYAISRLAFREGKKIGVRFTRKPHAHFLYGKDVPNWARPMAGWIFPRLGFIPVTNRGLCRESIDDIRKALKESPYPLALAPEGQVTYHSHRTFDLESGILHMAEWAEEHGPVRLLPISLAYDYGDQKGQVLDKVRQKWMKETGMPLKESSEAYAFLIDMTEKTVSLLEHSFPTGLETKKESLDERIYALNDSILKEAERMAHIRKSGSFLDRIFQLRYKGVDTLYPETRNPAGFTPWEKSDSDYECTKAAAYIRCSQIADVLEYVHTGYIMDAPLNNRHCEYALNLLDVVNR
ncbi:1-acyl-sn-glycerol-3-phosphate acyltransferase, partial [Oceanispirochaeta sp.]|uniref:1-acyl-sn-glycerol-3-phosphate acyltransferase n=1 Tax=Oceanispirochaeta sp. TaxID=2035350 RepID=UPI0026083F70